MEIISEVEKEAHLSNAGVDIVKWPKQIFEQQVDSNRSIPARQKVEFQRD